MRHVGGQNRVLESVKQVLNTVKQVLDTVKQVLNTVKQVIEQSKTQSNGRVIPLNQYKPAWDPEYRVCSYTPRFSYDGLKVRVAVVG